MLTKTITYTDYNGNERTEKFYFNLTEAELVEMEYTTSGGMKEMLVKIIEAQDNPSLFKVFKDFILKSYGEKSLDGREFIKVDKDGYRLVDKFMQTEAFSKLMIELVSDAKRAADFVNAVIPEARRHGLTPVQ